MKIALLGYGKMGRLIEKIATERRHEIVARIDEHTGAADLREADVAIDFSTPKAAPGNILNCLEAKVPVVCGTTGWNEEYPRIQAEVKKQDGALLRSSNFSLGVNLFFELNKYLARLMEPFPQYRATETEIHHIHKLDAPSGTAITLAEGIVRENNRYDGWQLEEDGKAIPENSIGIQAIREGEVPGIHTVAYTSSVDSIKIRHEAFSREGFAMGAVIAAEWIVGRKGIFSMRDVLFGEKSLAR